MFLSKIELKNFRSYLHAKIDLPLGVTLFEGDVGSGKSSVLYAIEFALFGLGELKSTHLLRHDAQSGFVKLNFTVGQKNYEVYRPLERKKDSAKQASGYLSEDGLKVELSAEELRREVLRILAFRENPSTKSTSWVYRYAVFTPQEEMKSILLLKREERLQTLRKAFGIEDYKLASENTSVVSRFFKEEEKFLSGQIADLPVLKMRFEQNKVLLEEKRRLAAEKHAELSLKQAELDAIRYSIENAREIIEKRNILSKELPLLKQSVSESMREKRFLESEILELEKVKEPAKPSVVLEDEIALKKAYTSALEDSRTKAVLLTELLSEEKNHSQLKQKGVCPTCGQSVSSFSESKLAVLREKIAGAQEALRISRKKEEDARFLVEKSSKASAILAVYSSDLNRFNDAKIKLYANENRLKEVSKKLLDFEVLVKEKQSLFESLFEQVRKIDELLQKESVLDSQLRKLVEESSAAKAFADRMAVEISQAETQIREKEEKQKILIATSEKRSWLEECFLPALQNIEEHVLARLNQDFSLLFQKWFNLLVESPDLSVDVDESFTPLVEQNGFEQDFQALSGGEKSALALSYRLSLNSIVREAVPSLKESLLILDEPTDGFSKEQLSRMRDVLRDIACKQVLLVSHEKELEGFVDQVFRVEKKTGSSTVSRL